MGHLRVSSCPKEAEPAPSAAVGVAGHGKDGKKSFDGGGWMYNRCWLGRQSGNSGEKAVSIPVSTAGFWGASLHVRRLHDCGVSGELRSGTVTPLRISGNAL